MQNKPEVPHERPIRLVYAQCREKLTESDSGWSRLTIDPERHPWYDDNEVARQVDLQQVIANLSLQPKRYIQHHSWSYNVKTNTYIYINAHF